MFSMHIVTKAMSILYVYDKYHIKLQNLFDQLAIWHDSLFISSVYGCTDTYVHMLWITEILINQHIWGHCTPDLKVYHKHLVKMTLY